MYLEDSIQPYRKLVKEGQMCFWVSYLTINGGKENKKLFTNVIQIALNYSNSVSSFKCSLEKCQVFMHTKLSFIISDPLVSIFPFTLAK